VRQGPGPDNALGQVKILFPNPYFVYLHDTNHRELFAKDERAFSSGCMRVERPLELAEKVLNDPAKWNAKSMAEAIAAGDTRTVRVERPIPVLVMYWTIDPLGEGRTVFKTDPYGRDAPLARALDAAYGSAKRTAAVASAR
jgi:murein L,D-transpeptidase YcbB/YkuD